MRFCECCTRGQAKEERGWKIDGEGNDFCPECYIPLLEANATQLQEFARWIVSMDDPEDVIGREERRRITFSRIADRAREALGES